MQKRKTEQIDEKQTYAGLPFDRQINQRDQPPKNVQAEIAGHLHHACQARNPLQVEDQVQFRVM
jgi:hypothetical protein